MAKTVRTTESLVKRGDAGKSLVVLRGAVSLGTANDFAGTKIKGGKGAGAGFLHRISKETAGKPKGSLWTASDAEIKAVASAAKAANKDVHEGNYTANVKGLLDAAYDNLTRKGGGGGGKKVTPMVF